MENETNTTDNLDAYEAPAIEKIGTLEELTKMQSSPNGDAPAAPGTAFSR